MVCYGRFRIRQDDREELPIDGWVDIINIRRIHIVRGGR